MFNRLTKYESWIRKNKEQLLDAWEVGFHQNGDPIDEKCYEDFVANCWQSYQDSEVDGLV